MKYLIIFLMFLTGSVFCFSSFADERRMVTKVINRKAVQGHIHPNGGGFVALTAHADPTAYVDRWSNVLDNAQVLHQSRIRGNSIINSTISGNAVISNRARVYASDVSGNAEISGTARVTAKWNGSFSSYISGNAKVTDNTRVISSNVSGNTSLSDQVIIRRSNISGHGHTVISDNVQVSRSDITSNLNSKPLILITDHVKIRRSTIKASSNVTLLGDTSVRGQEVTGNAEAPNCKTALASS